MYLLTLKSGENIRCDGNVFLEMYLKSYGFYNGILVASQTRDEIFLYPNLSVNGEFPSQRPVTRSFGVWFDLYLNKQLSKQSWGWWVEMPSRSLWRHFNEDPLNKPFSKKINVSYVEIRMFRVKWLKTMTSFDASPGHQYPQYCNNVIHSVYIQSLKKGMKFWLLKVWHRPGSASWFFSDFVRICAVYQWVVHIISDFVLGYRM